MKKADKEKTPFKKGAHEKGKKVPPAQEESVNPSNETFAPSWETAAASKDAASPKETFTPPKGASTPPEGFIPPWDRNTVFTPESSGQAAPPKTDGASPPVVDVTHWSDASRTPRGGGHTNTPPAAPPPAAPKRNRYADKMNRRKKKSKLPRVIAAVAVVGIAAGVIALLAARNKSDGDTVNAEETAVVTRGMLETYIEGDGTTAAKKREELGKDLKGTVSKVLVEVGDEVVTDQELVVVDPTETRKELETARKEVETAQKEVQTAQEQVEEAKNDLTEAQEAVTDAQENVVKLQAKAKEAQDNVTKAQNKASEVEKSLDKLTVTAPFSGKVIPASDSNGSTSSYAVGQQVSSGETIGYMVDDSVMKLSLDFSSAYSGQIQVGQSASISIPSAMSTATGSVSSIETSERVSDEGVKLFRVQIEIPNPGTLAKDMSATATISSAGGDIYPAGSGTLQYSREEAITAQMGGEITEVGSLDNHEYSSGATIMTLTSDAAKEDVQNAQDAIEDAKTALQSAQDAIETAQKSVTTAQKTVADRQKTVADRQQTVADRQQDVADKQQTVTELNKAISDATLKSPIDGVVVSLDAVEGANVSGSSALVIVADLSDIIVNANINATDVPNVEPGQDATMTMYLPDGEITLTGTVESVGMEANQDQNSSQGSMPTFPAVIALDPIEDQKILSGYPVQYQITTASSVDCLIVPSSAVVNTESGTAVFAKPGEGQTFQDAQPLPEGADVPPDFVLVPVDVGISDATNTEILWGVDEGTTVYLAGPEDLYSNIGEVAVG